MKKNMIRFSLLIGLLFIVIAVFIKNNVSNTKSIPEQSAPKTELVKTVNDENKKPLKSQDRKKRKTGFKSNEEIKQEYGKIETVHLWNGKVYTGAVVNSEELYSIVTVEGVVKIPMKDVKLREIIR